MNHIEENKSQQENQIELDSFVASTSTSTSTSSSSEINQDLFSPPLEDIRDRIRFYFDPINENSYGYDYDYRPILTQVIDSLENREDHSEQILLAKAENLPLQSLSSNSIDTCSCSINGFLQAVPSDSIEGLMSVSKQSGALNVLDSFFINITTDNRNDTINDTNKRFIKAKNSIEHSSSYKFEGLISLSQNTLMQSLSSNLYSEKKVFSKSVHPIDAIAHDLLKVENSSSCFRPYYYDTNTDNYEACYNVSNEESYRVICRRILNLDI